jgi:prolipoprotein diacylglyceryltransferase
LALRVRGDLGARVVEVLEPVADAAEVGDGHRLAEFVAQAFDVHVEGLALSVVVVSPHFLQQPGPGLDPGVGLVIWAERHLRIRKGYLFWVYAALYSIGRFFTEHLRIDEAHHYLGLRLKDWTSITILAAGTILLVTRGRARAGEPTTTDHLDPAPISAGNA